MPAPIPPRPKGRGFSEVMMNSILLVDDEAVVCTEFARTLESLRFEAEQRTRGSDPKYRAVDPHQAEPMKIAGYGMPRQSEPLDDLTNADNRLAVESICRMTYDQHQHWKKLQQSHHAKRERKPRIRRLLKYLQ
jgi:hypothetical protein